MKILYCNLKSFNNVYMLGLAVVKTQMKYAIEQYQSIIDFDFKIVGDIYILFFGWTGFNSRYSNDIKPLALCCYLFL